MHTLHNEKTIRQQVETLCLRVTPWITALIVLTTLPVIVCPGFWLQRLCPEMCELMRESESMSLFDVDAIITGERPFPVVAMNYVEFKLYFGGDDAFARAYMSGQAEAIVFRFITAQLTLQYYGNLLATSTWKAWFLTNRCLESPLKLCFLAMTYALLNPFHVYVRIRSVIGQSRLRDVEGWDELLFVILRITVFYSLAFLIFPLLLGVLVGNASELDTESGETLLIVLKNLAWLGLWLSSCALVITYLTGLFLVSPLLMLIGIPLLVLHGFVSGVVSWFQ